MDEPCKEARPDRAHIAQFNLSEMSSIEKSRGRNQIRSFQGLEERRIDSDYQWIWGLFLRQ